MIDLASADPIEPPAPVNKTLRSVNAWFMKLWLSPVTAAENGMKQVQGVHTNGASEVSAII